MGILSITVWTAKVLDHVVFVALNLSSCASSETEHTAVEGLCCSVYGKKRGFMAMRT